MKRCKVCGCVVEDNVARCPQCGVTEFDALENEDKVGVWACEHHVGDGKVEIALGREAGALTLGIASMDIPGCDSDEMNADKYRRLENAGAHAIIPHFANVKEILSWI